MSKRARIALFIGAGVFALIGFAAPLCFLGTLILVATPFIADKTQERRRLKIRSSRLEGEDVRKVFELFLKHDDQFRAGYLTLDTVSNVTYEGQELKDALRAITNHIFHLKKAIGAATEARVSETFLKRLAGELKNAKAAFLTLLERFDRANTAAQKQGMDQERFTVMVNKKKDEVLQLETALSNVLENLQNMTVATTLSGATDATLGVIEDQLGLLSTAAKEIAESSL